MRYLLSLCQLLTTASAPGNFPSSVKFIIISWCMFLPSHRFPQPGQIISSQLKPSVLESKSASLLSSTAVCQAMPIMIILQPARQCSPEPSRYISMLSLKTAILPASLIKQIDLALLYVLFSCVCFCPVSDIALQSPSSQPSYPNWLYLEGHLEVTNAWQSILRKILTSSQTGDNVLWSLPASAVDSGKVAMQQRLQICSRHGCNKGLRVELGLVLFCN